MWLENLPSFDKEKKKKTILSEDHMQTLVFTLLGFLFFFFFKEGTKKSLNPTSIR